MASISNILELNIKLQDELKLFLKRFLIYILFNYGG